MVSSIKTQKHVMSTRKRKRATEPKHLNPLVQRLFIPLKLKYETYHDAKTLIHYLDPNYVDTDFRFKSDAEWPLAGAYDLAGIIHAYLEGDIGSLNLTVEFPRYDCSRLVAKGPGIWRAWTKVDGWSYGDVYLHSADIC